MIQNILFVLNSRTMAIYQLQILVISLRVSQSTARLQATFFVKKGKKNACIF